MQRPESQHLDDLIQKLGKIIPPSLKSTQKEFEKTARAGLEGIMQKLDLVCRKEYDVQTTLLSRCQEKISDLEKKISDLEKKLKKI